MANCWSRVPHAWLQETIDITDVEEWRQQHKAEIRKSGGSLTITTILAKAVAFALREFPRLNSSYDETANEVVYKDYVDIGIAVDTEYGLLVPNCRAVDRKGLMELSRDLATLTAKAHSRKLSTQDLQGGGITISNLGGIGLNAVFPIVNWPQVVILGVSAGTTRPKWLDGRVVPRFELTATIGFDHRVVNGAEGARFLRHVKKYVEDIRLMLL
jgi:pyruvate dehydrogenase E2 component (dihydrolipoamide acetyltransferase)